MPPILTIRPEQAQAFENKAEQGFRIRLLKVLLRDLLPDLPELTPGEIEKRMDRSLARAQDFKIESQVDRVRFAYLYVTIAPDLEDNPELEWMRHILEGPATGKLKLDHIESALEASQP